MKIYLATNNLHKKSEMSEIFSSHQIVTPSDEGIDFAPIENGKTFYENSIIKAKALYEIVRAPVLADDSGICVDALAGAPGIFSARYAGRRARQGFRGGKKLSQEKQNALLIEDLNFALAHDKNATTKTQQIPRGKIKLPPYLPEFKNGGRSCHYTCALVLYMGQDRIFAAVESMEGRLVETVESARGNGGFGYDPLVILPNGKTVAELTSQEKNAISHRGKACQAILQMMKINLA